VVRALLLACDQAAAHRVARVFREAATARSYRQSTTQSGPPPADEVRWAYDVLGVQPTATDGEVHQAWRRRRIEMHPDRAAGDVVEFERRNRISVDINRARDIIVSHRSRRAGAHESARAA
jgi:DnaJ-class molecular chaperone